MYLKKIIIKNFMIHEEFEQSFTNGLNVITGITKTGKTCMFKAIQWLYNQCTLSEKDYRREGTKETSVTGELSNGFTVERIRTNSINRYILKKDNCKDQVFDNFGKELPEEIVNALGISQIVVDKEHMCFNFADQDDMNFLIDKTYSDGIKAKLFNKLTGNEVLDKVFKELNKEALKTSKDIKINEDLIETQEEQIADYSLSYKSIKSKLSIVSKEFEIIKKDNEKIDELKSINNKLIKIKESEEFVKFKLSKLKIVDDKEFDKLKKEAKELNNLHALYVKLDSINKRIFENEINLKAIKSVDIDFEQLTINAKSLQNLRRLNSLIASLRKNQNELDLKIKNTKDKLKIKENEFAQFKLDNPNCPLCGKAYNE